MDDGDDSARRKTRADDGGFAPDMGADEDFRALAEDWIAIWQSEITAYLTDPETQASWAAVVALWAQAAQSVLRAMPMPPAGMGAATRERRAKPATGPKPRPDAAPGPAPAAAASDPRDDEVRRLEQRVAELERRLAGGDGEGTRTRGAAGSHRRTGGTGRRRG